MARPIWNGTISFGLLNVPVQLFAGERTVDLHLRMLDVRDKSPIRYERINSETGDEVPWKDVVKAFEYAKGNYVVIDEEELRKAHPEATETVDIEAFVADDAIDPRYFERPYYLLPARKSEKGYVLLREVLKKSKKIGIAKVVIRTRQYLAAVMPLDKALVLNLMRFPQELIDVEEYKLPDSGTAKYRITAKEIDMASNLVESMVTQWNPKDYRDDFRDKLRKIIDQQVKTQSGKRHRKAEKAQAPSSASTNVVDFMSLLKKSLAAKQANRSHTPESTNRGSSNRRKPVRRRKAS